MSKNTGRESADRQRGHQTERGQQTAWGADRERGQQTNSVDSRAAVQERAESKNLSYNKRMMQSLAHDESACSQNNTCQSNNYFYTKRLFLKRSWEESRRLKRTNSRPSLVRCCGAPGLSSSMIHTFSLTLTILLCNNFADAWHPTQSITLEHGLGDNPTM